MINIKVVKETSVTISEAFELISKPELYHFWWKIPVSSYDKKSGLVEFQPIPLVTIGVLVDPKGNHIEYQYVKGPFRGKGIWEFKNDTVSYEINLTATNAIFGVVGKSKPFRSRHISDIENIISELPTARKYL